MHKNRPLTVIACIGIIWLLSQLGLFNALNDFFYSRFQSKALNKQTQFATISIEQNVKDIPSYAQWRDVLNSALSWTNADVYVIDFFAQGENSELNEILQNERIHFVQSSFLDEDMSLKATQLPLGQYSNNTYSLNYPDFSNGQITDYIAVEGLYPDVIEKLHKDREQGLTQPYKLNFMIGQSYLPAVNFIDVIENKVDQRLFTDKTVIIVNQLARVVPTALSHSRPITQSQYYAYLFETALQDIELKKVDSVPLLVLLALIGSLVLFLSYFLPNRFRLPVVIFLSTGLVLLSFILLGATRYFLPVIEMLSAVLIPVFFIQRQDNKSDKEQLLLGTRLYKQILESSGKSNKQHSNSYLLASFSRFFCTLTGVKGLNYEILKKGRSINFFFDGDNLQKHVSQNKKGAEFVYTLALFHDLEATIAVDEIPADFDVDKIENLLKNKEQYLKLLLSQFSLEQFDSSRSYVSRLISSSRFTAEHEKFRITTDNFLSHYHLLKNNFESLQTASVLYGVNGEIIQTNQAAEHFIRENDIRLFNQTLIESLQEITELEPESIRNALLDLVDDQDTVIVWPTRKKGFDKSYLVTVSAYNTENINFGGFLVELSDIEEVNFIASLKNNFISELNNQLRNDFSEVMLAIDFLAMGIEGGLSLEEVNAKVLEFSKKLQSSDMMLQSTNDIMRDKHYPVDIRKLVAQGVKAINEAVEEKQLSLNIKQPRFINLVLINYQHFAQICKQLMLFAVQDCMDEGELSIIINELEKDSERFVSMVLKTKGYGIFDQAKISGNAQQTISEIPELVLIEKYILSIGGEMELESSVGEGTKISTLLPCYRF